jgi:HK97 family phage portal protein
VEVSLSGGLIDQYGNPLVVTRHTEGTYHSGPWCLPITGGWLPADVGSYWNWWQLGYSPSTCSSSAMVEACVSAYSQTIAMCPGDHWRRKDNAGRDRVTSSALSRLLRKPNAYQSISDFMLNAVRSLYLEGNAYALVLRNDRFEASELHLMDPRESGVRIATTGDVFYNLGGNEIIDSQIKGPLIVPARDVLHIRLHTPNHPLIGVSPLMAAALDIAAADAMMRQQLAFFSNQGRPSTVLATDMILDRTQVTDLRERWNEQAKGLNAGGVPILTAGLKPVSLGTSSRDAQLADIMKLTEQNIALVFRIPLQILGIGGTPYASTEMLMQSWIASGLGFALNHIEESIGQLFGLRGLPDEYLEFDTRALLRSSQRERMETLTVGVRGGVFKINEARAEEELAPVPGGDDIRIQQQDVPLDWHEQQQPKQAAPPAPPPADEQPDDGDEPDADKSGLVQWAARRLLDTADECDRRAA